MMKSIIIALVALFGLASAQVWTNCGTSSDLLTLSNVILAPVPIVRGQALSVNVSGSLSQSIDGGSATIKVTYLGVSVFSHTYDVCTDFAADVSCPVAAGPFAVGMSQVFPSYVPKGTYKGNLKLVTSEGAEVTCINFDIGVTSVESVPLDARPVVAEEHIAHINSVQKLWKAGHNAKFAGLTIREARRFLGAKLVAKGEKKPYAMTAHATAIPTSFDSRQQWPTCIHPIRDQQQCGSCWAFGATESFSDRLCIASKGATNVVLSPEDLVSCDSTNYGCDGGYLLAAWEYMQTTGVVSDSCFPYTAGSGTAPACVSKCVDGSAWTKYHVAKSSIAQPADAASIQTLIMTSGPVEAAFTVYEDFFNYKAGVYTYTTGQEVGGHAIKIVGWGVTADSAATPYWIVANSWGTSWGMNGFFWIRRGTDECGIEDNVVAGLPA